MRIALKLIPVASNRGGNSIDMVHDDTVRRQHTRLLKSYLVKGSSCNWDSILPFALPKLAKESMSGQFHENADIRENHKNRSQSQNNESTGLKKSRDDVLGHTPRDHGDKPCSYSINKKLKI